MKKILAILVAAIMIACLSVTAFAVTDAEVDKANIPSAQIGPGKTVAPGSDVTAAKWHDDSTDAGRTVKASLKTAIENTNAADGVNASVLYLLDVSTTDGSTTAKLKFSMPAGKKLAYVLSYNVTAGAWEKVEASYADGTLTITSPNGWSHVAITVQNTAAGGQTSPQTGEVTTSVYVAFAALMAVAAAAFFIRSRKAA
ncbi:MAG: LPXTG cell wall anchor domain-containing protein [Oscillospiraceae bacterium]|nr:LPXTG cell wall anchor domain-containing protein [Oscillospiraceae bacterium]